MAKVATTSSAASGTPISLTAPTGITSGDLLVLMVSTNLNNSTYSEITTPTGFTLIGNARTATTTGGNNSTINTSLYYKVAGVSEPGSYSIAFDAANGRATMLRITGWYASYTFTDYASNTYSSGTASATANAFTVTAPTLTYAGNLVLALPAQQGIVNFTAAASGYTYTSEIANTAIPAQSVFSTQVPSGTSFPLTTVTPASSVTSQADTLFFLAVPHDRAVISSLSSATTLNTAAFTRFVSVSALNAVGTIVAATASVANRAWSTVTKHAATWTNQNKS